MWVTWCSGWHSCPCRGVGSRALSSPEQSVIPWHTMQGGWLWTPLPGCINISARGRNREDLVLDLGAQRHFQRWLQNNLVQATCEPPGEPDWHLPLASMGSLECQETQDWGSCLCYPKNKVSLTTLGWDWDFWAHWDFWGWLSIGLWQRKNVGLKLWAVGNSSSNHTFHKLEYRLPGEILFTNLWGNLLEGLEDVSAPTSSSKQGQIWGQKWLLRAFSSSASKTSKDRDSTVSLDKLFWHLILPINPAAGYSFICGAPKHKTVYLFKM